MSGRQAFARGDPRPTPEIVADLLTRLDRELDDVASDMIAVLHARGSQAEFDAGVVLCAAPDVSARILGANILAQLGWSDQTFLDASVDALLALLTDPCADVVGAAGVALGHRNVPRAIEPALRLVSHASAEVRFGAVMALTNHDRPDAIAGLIVLSADPDLDVREWATFGLASMTQVDSAELRNALMIRTSDENAEVRGEALVGLAQRGDPRVLTPLARELAGPFHGAWSLEAAALLGDPGFASVLIDLKVRMAPVDLIAFGGELEGAIAACTAPTER